MKPVVEPVELADEDYMSFDELVEFIGKLTEKQKYVLGCVAMNQDLGHPQSTIRALLNKDLIIEQEQRLPGHPPMTIKRYNMHPTVHYAYCMWASTQPLEEEDDAAD